MPRGIAVRLGDASARWHAGSQVFQLYPSLGQFEGQDDLVVVACTPAARDHGNPETTVFKCDLDGDTKRYGGLDRGAEALSQNERIIGKHDIDAALANLSGGYFAVTEEEHQALRPAAAARAQEYAQRTLAMGDADAADYAHNNWGMFAALAIESSGERPSHLRTLNHVYN